MSRAEHRRHAPTALRLLGSALLLHVRLLARWPVLAEQFRQALPELVSPSAWERTLGLPPTPPAVAGAPEVRPAAQRDGTGPSLAQCRDRS